MTEHGKASFFGIVSWGDVSYGQLGIGNVSEDAVLAPVHLENEEECFTEGIREIFCGWQHTVFLMENGSVYSCGLNEDGQCGHAKSVGRPERIDALEAMVVTHVGCGMNYTVVVNDKGQMFSFGNNEHGQLGIGNQLVKSSPKLIRSLPTHHVKQITCGASHSIALTSGGHLFSWGSNRYGQLGLNSTSDSVHAPQRIEFLAGVPIYQTAAGGYHSLVLTISGTLFSWGRNNCGQLGLGNTNDKLVPTLVEQLRMQCVRYVACGEEHTAVLTKSGGVFTFGSGVSGQLGHYSFNSELNPRQVMELMGSPVTQIACGRKHTLAFVSNTGKLYAFGLGGSGQLGLESYEKKNYPCVVRGKWFAQDTSSVRSHRSGAGSMELDSGEDIVYVLDDLEADDEPDGVQIEVLEGNNNFPEDSVHLERRNNVVITDWANDLLRQATRAVCIYQIFAGGLQSFAITMLQEAPFYPVDQRKICLKRSPGFVNSKSMLALASELKESSLNDSMSRGVLKVELAFSHHACLNGSFLHKAQHQQTSVHSHGIHLPSVRKTLAALASVESIKKLLPKIIEGQLLPALKVTPAYIEGLRVFMIIPELPFFKEPEHIRSCVIQFGDCLVHLLPEAQKVIRKWWSLLPETYFSNILEAFKHAVKYLLEEKLPITANEVLFSLHAALLTCMRVLEILNQVNADVGIVSYDAFYVPEIMNKIDVQQDYLNWIQHPNVFCFCRYPFVLDAKAKTVLLTTDASIQMQSAVDETHLFNITGLFAGSLTNPISPLLVLHVRRDHLVQDTLTGIIRAPHDLKKPLKVVFSGEDAVDAGGVRKEFFLLLLREILDPKYGMFSYNEESYTIYLNPDSFEDPEMFMLIGTICGLAIYNSTIIDVNFPMCLYKKLLGRPVNLEDFYSVRPGVARSLQYMLDYDGADFADVFDFNFQVTTQSFGEVRNIELTPGGESVRVTQENKQQYVDLYVDYVLNKSVEPQFRAFYAGFHRVCGGRVLEFFHPQELMEMVVGCQDYDFYELEQSTEYKGEYYRNHPVISNFWTVLHAFPIETKKQFLAFVTGSNKVPIFGMKKLKFIIQPVAGGEKGDHLPVAHTCFNVLDLPRYPTLEMMRSKLSQAIENSEGFGIV